MHKCYPLISFQWIHFAFIRFNPFPSKNSFDERKTSFFFSTQLTWIGWHTWNVLHFMDAYDNLMRFCLFFFINFLILFFLQLDNFYRSMSCSFHPIFIWFDLVKAFVCTRVCVCVSLLRLRTMYYFEHLVLFSTDFVRIFSMFFFFFLGSGLERITFARLLNFICCAMFIVNHFRFNIFLPLSSKPAPTIVCNIFIFLPKYNVRNFFLFSLSWLLLWLRNGWSDFYFNLRM